MRIFLGGYPGAGKTSLARYLVRERGWFSLDMDSCGTNRVLELLDAPAGHPEFSREPFVVEGGFLEQAPEFQEMIQRHGLRSYWLTGTFEQLRDARRQRQASWDRSENLDNPRWMRWVEEQALQRVHWDHQIQMWHDDGTRKTFDEIFQEILNTW